MDHPEQSAESQTSWEASSGWGEFDTFTQITETGSPSQRMPLAGRAQQRPALLLSTLATAAHTLADADQSALLPLALGELLTLSGCRSGLVLTYHPEREYAQVAIRQYVPEALASCFVKHPVLLESAPGVIVPLPPEPIGAAGGVGRLARAGAHWYLALPLRVSGTIEAVLVVLGESPLPAPVECLALASAAVLLGEAASAALERAHLRHLLTQEQHARDEFIGLASHELKNPLTIIKGYAQLLLRQAARQKGASVDTPGLEAISHQVSRMSTLVDELLDVSRLERGTLEVRPKSVELTRLVERVVEQHQRSLEEGSLHFSTSEPEVQVLADPARLEQVLGYLLDNAVKFGQQGGQVEIEVERAPASRIPADVPQGADEKVASEEDGSGESVALISIRDYGLGMPPAERGRLFSAFYRGPEQSIHRQLSGLGLSLYLSRYLIARQDGHLWAEFPLPESSVGSFFYISLPLLSAS